MRKSQYCRHFLTMLRILQNFKCVVMESGCVLALDPAIVCVKITEITKIKKCEPCTLYKYTKSQLCRRMAGKC